MATNKTREITLAEVKEHSTAEDCWVAINSKVYDVTDYLDIHPGGGESIEAEAGTDSTKAYDLVGHSAYAVSLMAPYQVGVVVEEKKEDPIPEKSVSFILYINKI
ncbi:Cytochrome B5 [Lamellibrachia satsuma]|nr:Cytochrome B5 [Lamellibrachia satsuma]